MQFQHFNKRFTVIAATSLCSLFFACENNVDNQVEPAPQLPKMKQPIEVVNGTLRVASSGVFRDLMTSLKKMEDQELINWNKQMGFTSLLEDQQSKQSARMAATETDDLFPEPADLVSDPQFAAVLNSNGEVYIGDLKARITSQVVFLYEPAQEHVVNNLAFASYGVGINTGGSFADTLSTESFSKIAPGVMAALISRSPIMPTPGMAEAAIWPGRRDEKHHHFAGDRRFVAVTWNENYLLFSSLGCKTKNQRRRLGIWWRNRAEFMRMEWRAEIVLTDMIGTSITIPRSGVREASDDGKVTYTIDWNMLQLQYNSENRDQVGGGFGADLVDPSKPYNLRFYNTFHVVRDNGQTASLRTNL